MKIIALDKVEAKGANFILEKYLPIPENAVTLLSALGGTGKAIYINENVLTPDGWTQMKHLKINDYVIGSDGKKTKILGVYPQGIRPTYKITFIDKTEVICDEEHLWTVKSSSRKSGTFTVKQILEKGYFRDKKDKRYNTIQREYYYGIPMCKDGYDFGNDEKLTINPYLLGLLLGDGSFRGGNISFTNSNINILKDMQKLLPDEDIMTIKKVNNTFECTIKRKVKTQEKSETFKQIKDLGLIGHLSIDKFIPSIYKNATLESRKKIIKGLIDTDGYINNGNLEEYSTSSKQLADDFLEVGRSIGMFLTVKDRIPKFSHNGEKKEGNRSYRIYNKNQNNKKIVNIEKIENKEMVCIKVDAKDELFVVNGFNLTHNTRLSLIMASKFISETKGDYNVSLWLTEDYQGQVREIFDNMIKDRLVEDWTISNMLLILDEPPQLAKRDKGLFKANYEEISKIGNYLIDRNVKLAIFDPLLAFYGGNENDNSEARVFIQSFATWANRAEITTVIIHHASKDGGSRGATAFHDGVRARYELDVPKDKDGNIIKELMAKGFRVAKLKKDNWGIRKHLWRLTDGVDEITLKVAPTMKNDYQPVSEVVFSDNSFLSSIS